MISATMQAVDPLFALVTKLFSLPRIIWERVKETIRTTVSVNGYTAINPDGVLMKNKDAEDEGESKED